MSVATTAQILGNLLRDDRYVAVVSAAFNIDDVTLLSLEGEERLGRPFAYQVRVSCGLRIRDFARVPGQRMTVGMKLKDGATRYIDGFVEEFRFAGIDDSRGPIYEAKLVPWLAFLHYRRNSRIFQNMTGLDIVKAIFSEHGGRVVDRTTSAKPPRRPFCVQYDETDLDFVHRLMEQDGIYYFFEHPEGRHALVLCDGPGAHRTCAPEIVETNLNLRPYRVQNDIIWKWTEIARAQTARVVLDDYDHEKPEANLQVRRNVTPAATGGVPTIEERQAAARQGGHSGVKKETTSPDSAGKPATAERFVFPGRYLQREDGEFYARIQTEEIASGSYRAIITGSPRQVTTGSVFKAADPIEITAAEQAPLPKTAYLAIATRIRINGDVELEEDEAAKPFFYHAEIEIQPQETPFRPPCITPRPTISGPQTAVCVGDSGDVVTTDALGRIKVQFFWDREGKMDRNSSCWIRVAQNWAGKNFGGLVTPRIGQEVVVAFIGGNPDWPLVIGAVYNGTHKPPETLPQDSLRSTFRTRTEKGTVDRYNELAFEDKAGSEEVFLRAQRDYRVAVGERYAVDVAKDYSLTMKRLPHPPADEPGAAMPSRAGLGSSIHMTPEKIAFSVNNGATVSTLELGIEGISLVVRGPTGPQVVDIGIGGIAMGGTTIGLQAKLVTAQPFPVPVVSPQATAAMTKAALPIDDISGTN